MSLTSRLRFRAARCDTLRLRDPTARANGWLRSRMRFWIRSARCGPKAPGAWGVCRGYGRVGPVGYLSSGQRWDPPARVAGVVPAAWREPVTDVRGAVLGLRYPQPPLSLLTPSSNPLNQGGGSPNRMSPSAGLAIPQRVPAVVVARNFGLLLFKPHRAPPRPTTAPAPHGEEGGRA